MNWNNSVSFIDFSSFITLLQKADCTVNITVDWKKKRCWILSVDSLQRQKSTWQKNAATEQYPYSARRSLPITWSVWEANEQEDKVYSAVFERTQLFQLKEAFVFL
jgi:hypothetical protein